MLGDTDLSDKAQGTVGFQLVYCVPCAVKAYGNWSMNFDIRYHCQFVVILVYVLVYSLVGSLTSMVNVIIVWFMCSGSVYGSVR